MGTSPAGASGYGSGRPATLSVSTRPVGATVLVDGDSVGTTPLTEYALPAGTYRLSIQKGGRLPVDTMVSFRADQAWTFVALLDDEAAPEDRSGSKNHVLVVGPAAGGQRPVSRPAQKEEVPARAATATPTAAPSKEEEWRESKEARQARIQGYVEEVRQRQAERRERLLRHLKKEQAGKETTAVDTARVRRKW